jgi:hypothetical protein
MSETRRDWLKTGEKIMAEGIEHETQDGVEYWPISRERIEQAIINLTWEPAKGEKPMSPALGIKAVIEECGIPKVDEIAIGHELAPYGFYGIHGHYRDGDARVYVLDRGHDLVPLCVDFTPRPS